MHSFQTERFVSAWAVHLKKVPGSRSPKASGEQPKTTPGASEPAIITILMVQGAHVYFQVRCSDAACLHCAISASLSCQPDQRSNLNIDLPVEVGVFPD